MTTLQIEKGLLSSSINLPRSKSFANRALILGALSQKIITISNIPESTDVLNLIKALELVGLSISKRNNHVSIKNSFPACEFQTCLPIDIGEGGTTARFLAAFLLLGKIKYNLILGKRLKDRPWNDFVQLVNELGGYASLNNNVLSLQGPLKVPAQLEVDCSQTSQFATAFLLAFGNESNIIPKNLNSSGSYWSLSKELVEVFKRETLIEVPIDWSSASYPIVFAALNQEVSFPKLGPDKLQADSKLLQILEDLKSAEVSTDGIKIRPTKLTKQFDIDVSDCLDLVPSLCFLFSHIPGNHKLRGIQNLLFKESDRAQELVKLLSQFSKKAWVKENDLYIEGNSQKVGSKIDLVLPEDHRIVMTGALFLLHHAGGTLSPSEAVEKSYPGFFQILDT